MHFISLLAVLLALTLSACDKDRGKNPDELLAEDTTLAIDLARANDALDDGDPDTSGLGLTDDDRPVTDAPAEDDPATPPATLRDRPAAQQSPQPRVPRPVETPPVAPSAPREPVRTVAPTVPSAPVAPSDVASGPGCSSPATADQRSCLLALLARYDVGLNSEYRSVIRRMRSEAGVEAGQPDPPAVQRLRSAQRSWLIYRDRECRSRTRSREGELWAPARARCLGQLSSQRTRELQSM